jgi:acylphosphatase
MTEPDQVRPDARLDALVSGWVQGVGFRVFVARQATALGLAGWVRNEPDGGVRVVVEGPRPALESLRASLAAGPAGANVTAVSIAWSAALGTLERFEIRSGSTPGD